MSDGVELCLPWDVTDDGDDHIIASAREPVEVARVPHGQGADDLAAFIVRAANEHIGLTRALHRVEGEARAQRTRAEAAEAEVARLRATSPRIIPPTEAEAAAHNAALGWWLISREGVCPPAAVDAFRGDGDVAAYLPMARGATWLPLDRDGRPTAWPTTKETTE